MNFRSIIRLCDEILVGLAEIVGFGSAYKRLRLDGYDPDEMDSQRVSE